MLNNQVVDSTTQWTERQTHFTDIKETLFSTKIHLHNSFFNSSVMQGKADMNTRIYHTDRGHTAL